MLASPLGPRPPGQEARSGVNVLRRRILNPGWPITLLLVGFPVLWAIGLGGFAAQILAVPMAIELLRRRPIRVPKGFGIWLMFLLCSAVGIFALGVNPTGTLPDTATGRLIGFGTRQSTYLAATIMLLYIGNLTAAELSDRRMVKLLSWSFVIVAIGGVLGLLWPYASFTSLFELFLPAGIRSNSFVERLVHPSFAQVQAIGGEDVPRPSAPYAYTNTWGSQISLFGIWFVVGWLILFRGWQRVLGAAVLGVGIVTVVYSVNRGVWIGILLGVTFVALVLALRGRTLLLGGMVISLTLAGAVFLNSPLRQVLDQRLADGHSNGVRAFTSQRAFELSKHSPVIGFGSTRSAVGSKSSIAIGKSPQCPNCGNIPIGINGTFFTLVVTTGYAGTLLFFLFLADQAWRSRRDRDVIGVACRLTLVTSVFYCFFYSISFVVPFVALAIMWRRRMSARSEFSKSGLKGDEPMVAHSVLGVR